MEAGEQRAQPAVEPASAQIGQRIRAVRRAQRLTVDSLAQASGLTRSFLSKVERGRSTASVAALLRIAQALSIPLSALFETSSTRQVLRSSDYPQVNFGGERLTEFLLTPHAERRIQVLLSKIRPGGGSGPELYPLPGEVEFLFVVSGVLEVTFADSTLTLQSGDAVTFDPASYRAFRVPKGAAVTTVLWVISPALPHVVYRGSDAATGAT